MAFFKNLIFNVSKESALLGLNAAFDAANYRKIDGKLQFRSNKGYDNVYVYAAKRTLLQRSFAELNDLYPSIVRKADRKAADIAYKENQGSVKQKVISDGRNLMEALKVKWNYRGGPTDEGVLMWIKNSSGKTERIEFNTYWDKVKNLSNANALSALTSTTYADVPGDAVLLDMTATVQMQSHKNIVLTKVQGRDCTRKELISNGDMEFTVTGKIVSNFPDVYPTAEVSKLITLMQYKGVIQVFGLMFHQLNVSQILVKDFRLTQNAGFKNVQPYSFSCVAVEPDYNTQIVEDTLTGINLTIVNKEKSGWGKLLDEVKDSAIKQASNTIESLTARII